MVQRVLREKNARRASTRGPASVLGLLEWEGDGAAVGSHQAYS